MTTASEAKVGDEADKRETLEQLRKRVTEIPADTNFPLLRVLELIDDQIEQVTKDVG